MKQDIDLTVLLTDELARLCARETDRFFQGKPCDPRYGFELFRRALVEREQLAWEKIYLQYSPLVNSWVRQHSLFVRSGEEAQYFANRAFERMWTALTPAKFSRFPNLKSILRYLQMCAHSVIVDDARRSNRLLEDTLDESEAHGHKPPRSGLESQIVDRLQDEALWRLISVHLKDDKERHVLYGCFVLNLKPRDLCVRFRSVFKDVHEVYRVKQNVFARLRRDPELINLFRELA